MARVKGSNLDSILRGVEARKKAAKRRRQDFKIKNPQPKIIRPGTKTKRGRIS